MIRRLRLILWERNIIKREHIRHCFFCALLLNASASGQSGPPPGYGNNIDEQMAEMQVQVR